MLKTINKKSYGSAQPLGQKRCLYSCLSLWLIIYGGGVGGAAGPLPAAAAQGSHASGAEAPGKSGQPRSLRPPPRPGASGASPALPPAAAASPSPRPTGGALGTGEFTQPQRPRGGGRRAGEAGPQDPPPGSPGQRPPPLRLPACLPAQRPKGRRPALRAG